MRESHREAIRQGQLRRHAAIREAHKDVPEPTHKRCSKCKQLKLLTEFSTSSRKISTGIKRYPKGACRKCEQERKRAWREANPEKARASNRAAWLKRESDPLKREERRAYQRDYGRLKRQEQGAVSRGAWRRYRPDERNWFIPAEQFKPVWELATKIASVRTSKSDDSYAWLGLEEQEYDTIVRSLGRDGVINFAVAEKAMIAADLPYTVDDFTFVTRKGAPIAGDIAA